ncbi:MAG: glycosyltransferase [Prevotella sp.]
MKALIITRHYLDQQLGGPNCSKAFIKALTDIYEDCTLIYPEHNDKQTDLSQIVNKNTYLVPCFDKRCALIKCLDMYKGKIHRFGKTVKSLLENHHFDVIFIDHSFTASSGVIESAVKSHAKIVTLHHNVESLYIKDNEQNLIFRYPYNHFSLKAEHKAIINSCLNLTLTRYDKDCFVKQYENKRDTFGVLGMFEYQSKEMPIINNKNNLTFIISGSLSAAQTETAVITFLNEYTESLNDICPNYKLIITGRNPSNTLLSICKGIKQIEIVPNPEDILSIIDKGCFYICPLFTGSGLKLRIMDALRLGLPVVAHEVSVRGYEDIAYNGFMFGYSDKQSFKQAIKRILSVEDHKKVAECYFSYFSFNAGKERLAKLLKQHHLV